MDVRVVDDRGMREIVVQMIDEMYLWARRGEFDRHVSRGKAVAEGARGAMFVFQPKFRIDVEGLRRCVLKPFVTLAGEDEVREFMVEWLGKWDVMVGGSEKKKLDFVFRHLKEVW